MANRILKSKIKQTRWFWTQIRRITNLRTLRSLGMEPAIFHQSLTLEVANLRVSPTLLWLPHRRMQLSKIKLLLYFCLTNRLFHVATTLHKTLAQILWDPQFELTSICITMDWLRPQHIHLQMEIVASAHNAISKVVPINLLLVSFLQGLQTVIHPSSRDNLCVRGLTLPWIIFICSE